MYSETNGRKKLGIRWHSLAALVVCLWAVELRAAEPQFRAFRGTVSGSYNYWFFDPQTEPDERAHYPLLIFLHGASLCGTNMDKVKRYGPISAVARGRSIDSYILAPQNPGGAWKPERVMKIVDWAIANYAVDTTRIYVYGMSLGGYGTIDVATSYPNRIAAAMAICGGGTAKNLGQLSQVPLWIIHGTADRAVSIKESDRVVSAIQATGDDSRLIYTRLQGVDHGRPARLFYMLQTYDWLFSHSTQDPGRPVCRDFEITPELLKNAYQDLGRASKYEEEEEALDME
ncbi:MAG: prolyl oligopeptidase family serine peptidase [Bacteroidaceae bacterium]|nr:prolyl oligopeptidase family serine peptidase [Bacteroidaceae bacterium]